MQSALQSLVNVDCFPPPDSPSNANTSRAAAMLRPRFKVLEAHLKVSRFGTLVKVEG